MKNSNDTFVTQRKYTNSNPFNAAEVEPLGLKLSPLAQLLNGAKIDLKEDLKPPEVCLQFKDKIIGTLGNFSLVIGKPKSRKSFFMSLITSAACKPNTDFNGLIGVMPKNRRDVLFFDTEQGKYHVIQNGKRVCNIIEDEDPENLHVYGLRKFQPIERMNLIRCAIEDSPNASVVIIDGVRDLVTSINDEEQATTLSSFLLELSEVHNIHIMVVLHQNKGDSNARGHLGTELVNKGEITIEVERNDDTQSTVSTISSRDLSPERFTFRVNEQGLPIITEDIYKSSPSQAHSIANWDNPKKESLVEELFNQDIALSNKDLMKRLEASTLLKESSITTSRRNITAIKEELNTIKLISRKGQKSKWTRLT